MDELQEIPVINTAVEKQSFTFLPACYQSVVAIATTPTPPTYLLFLHTYSISTSFKTLSLTSSDFPVFGITFNLIICDDREREGKREGEGERERGREEGKEGGEEEGERGRKGGFLHPHTDIHVVHTVVSNFCDYYRPSLY